jgi:uncharacterized protein
MINRKITEKLTSWSLSLPRKPLLVYGAVQTGKTTLLKEFSKKFNQVIYLDLNEYSDRRVFEKKSPPAEILDGLFFLKEKHPGIKRTLVILDEVTASDAAFAWFAGAGNLAPDLFITATSSFNPEEKTAGTPPPVTTDKILLQPLAFSEFLASLGDKDAFEAYNEVPVPVSGYDKLLRYFHLYTLIGGMPAVVGQYVSHRGLAGLRPVYEEIMTRVQGEIDSSVSGSKSRELVSFALQNAFPYAATRIRFSGFGNSGYRSREIGDAFRWLEARMLLKLLYPSTGVTSPMLGDEGKSPRLQMIDTGLVNYFSGIQKTLYLSRDMNAIFQGQVARQVAGQELLAAGPDKPLHFWVRDKAQSTAEVDFLVPYEEMLIPVEVKSGEPGRLRSLHQFMDAAPHPYAVRLHAGPLHIRQAETIRGKRYFLLSLPYFLAEKINEHLRGFIRFVGN